MIVSAIRAACVVMMTSGRDENRSSREQDGNGRTKRENGATFAERGRKQGAFLSDDCRFQAPETSKGHLARG